MKIVIVAWGEQGENIITASSDEFRNQGLDTELIGILCCKDHQDPVSVFNQKLSNANPDIILWWFWACDLEFIKTAKVTCPAAVHIMFNWDDPHCWTYKLNCMEDRLVYFDMVLACSSEQLNEYQKVVPSSHLYFPPFSPKYHYYDYSDMYACDVSFICTNLYENKEMFPNQFVDRKALLQAFDKSSLNFHLYGPDSVKEAAPRSYKGSIDFATNRQVFSSSKINLCTHVMIARDYLNERVVTCLSSKGLLLTDPSPGLGGFLKDGEHVITMKSNNPDQIVKQAEEMVERIREYDKVKVQGQEAIQRQHLSAWVNGILEMINKHLLTVVYFNGTPGLAV